LNTWPLFVRSVLRVYTGTLGSGKGMMSRFMTVIRSGQVDIRQRSSGTYRYAPGRSGRG
jgi:hypothetical protein